MSVAAQERPSPERAARLRFGNFEVDFAAGELRKHGLKIKLQQRPLEVLRILLEKPGTVVTREELQRRIWNGVVVDLDHGLNTAVRKLRDALSDTAATPRYIATVDRQGYRFVAPVTELPATTVVAEVPRLADEAVVPSMASIGRFPAVLRWGLIALLAVALVAAFLVRRLRAPTTPAASRMVVAVLPFENLTGEAGQDYFIDGLTAETIVQIGRIDPSHVGVISRSSVMQYKKGQEQMERIAGELGVGYVLEGTVRRDGNHVRVTAELMHTAGRSPLWAREYDREVVSDLALQGEIAQEIADEVQLTLAPHDGTAPSRNRARPAGDEAYDRYVKGRYFWNKRSLEGFNHAIEYFQQAIAKDPNYARAYAGLADSYLLMASYDYARPEDAVSKARAAALRALQLDENLAEAHTSLALLAENADWDWETAEKEFRRAIELDPNYATAHQWYGEYLAFQGRFNEARVESARARELDPLSLIIAADRGAVFYFAGQYDSAIEQFRAVVEMQPDSPRAEFLLVACYVEKRSFSEAFRVLDSLMLSKDDIAFAALSAFVNARMGRRDQARRELRKLLASHSPEFNTRQVQVSIYAAMNDRDQAMALLERAYAEGDNSLSALKVEHAYDPLRGDPRFQDLLRRMRLAN